MYENSNIFPLQHRHKYGTQHDTIHVLGSSVYTAWHDNTTRHNM